MVSTNQEDNNEYKLSNSTRYFAPTRTMFIDEELHHLTNREHTFMLHLLENNSIITYEEIRQLVNLGTMDAKRCFVKNLRKKVPKNLIRNVSGVGYKLTQYK